MTRENKIRFYEERLSAQVIDELKRYKEMIQDIHPEIDSDFFYLNLVEIRYFIMKEEEELFKRRLNKDF